MKKISFTLVLVMLLLVGCESANVPKITDYEWIMTSVQSGERGEAVACGIGSSDLYGGAVEIELVCEAENGVLTISDLTNNKTYKGTYSLISDDPKSYSYEVEIEGKSGYAVSGMTTYHDGSQDPTFIINLIDYTVNFFSAQAQ